FVPLFKPLSTLLSRSQSAASISHMHLLIFIFFITRAQRKQKTIISSNENCFEVINWKMDFDNS
ncbi:5935_t:CDS:1, partial [Dentiscutata erythropus]